MTSTSFLHHAFGNIQQSLQGLDSYFSSFGSWSSSRSLSWTKTWDKATSQAQLVRNMLTGISQTTPGSIFTDKRIETIQLSCHESASYTPLSSLSGNELQQCQLDLIQSNGDTITENVSTLLQKGDQNGDYFGLLRVLKLLTTGNGSIESTNKLLKEESYRSITDQLGHEEMRTSGLGGQFSSTYTSTFTSKIKNLFSFFYPAATTEEQASASNDWSTLTTICKIFPKDPNSMDCAHTLKSDSSGLQLESLKVYNHVDSKEIYDQNGQAVNSWNLALRKFGLISSTSVKNVSGGLENEKKMKIYPTLWSQITASLPSFQMPKTSSWLPLLMIPAGIGITVGGIVYTKNSYQDESKSPLRKGVALTTGVATAALGVGLALSPFGAFSN